MKNLRVFKTIDGCEAAAYVAYRLNESMAIYPITPSSPIAEWCDQWAAEGKKNLWNTTPAIVEMQSEVGAVDRLGHARRGISPGDHGFCAHLPGGGAAFTVAVRALFRRLSHVPRSFQ